MEVGLQGYQSTVRQTHRQRVREALRLDYTEYKLIFNLFLSRSDEREDSDNLSQPDDAAQKLSLQVSQVSLPGSPEYGKSAITQLE